MEEQVFTVNGVFYDEVSAWLDCFGMRERHFEIILDIGAQAKMTSVFHLLEQSTEALCRKLGLTNRVSLKKFRLAMAGLDELLVGLASALLGPSSVRIYRAACEATTSAASQKAVGPRGFVSKLLFKAAGKGPLLEWFPRFMAPPPEFPNDELTDMLLNADVSVADIASFSSATRAAAMRRKDVHRALVRHCQAQAAEFLMDSSTMEWLQSFEELVRCVLSDDLLAVRDILSRQKNHEDSRRLCLKRDSGGNVCLHHALSEQVVDVLLNCARQARHMQNRAGQTPAQKHLEQERPRLAMKLFTNPVEWHAVSDTGKSAAMLFARHDSGWAASLAELMPRWEEVAEVLQLECAAEVLSRVECLETQWGLKPFFQLVLPWHCFSDAYVNQCHTETSCERLRVVWDALQRFLFILQGTGEEAAGRLAYELLEATKGPSLVGWDPRQPYREELDVVINRMSADSGAVLEEAFGVFCGAAAATSKSFCNALDAIKQFTEEMPAAWLPDSVDKAPQLSGWSKLREDWFKLRMDFRLLPDLVQPPTLSMPAWAAQSAWDCSMSAKCQSLEEARMLDEEGANSVYDFLQLGSPPPRATAWRQTLQESVIETDARWYAAWLQGVCKTHHEEVNEIARGLLRKSGADKFIKQLTFRRQAKGPPRLWERLAELHAELGKVSPPSGDAEWFYRTAANYMLDIVGCEAVFDTAQDMRRCYECIARLRWVTEKALLVGADNGFRKDLSPGDGYRDLRLYLAVGVPLTVGGSGQAKQTALPLEIQLHVKSIHAHKAKLRIPYEYRKGGAFDWPHVLKFNANVTSSWDVVIAARNPCNVTIEQVRDTCMKATRALDCQKDAEMLA